jgi:nitrogen fixation/metabolism regulation signal transduction histidine kinase
LGLAIVLEIAEKHQAKVFLTDTRPRQAQPGAKFSVVFST